MRGLVLVTLDPQMATVAFWIGYPDVASTTCPKMVELGVEDRA